MYDTFTAKLKNIYNSTFPVTVTKQKLVRKWPAARVNQPTDAELEQELEEIEADLWHE